MAEAEKILQLWGKKFSTCVVPAQEVNVTINSFVIKEIQTFQKRIVAKIPNGEFLCTFFFGVILLVHRTILQFVRNFESTEWI